MDNLMDKRVLIKEILADLDAFEIETIIILLGNPTLDYEPCPRIKEALNKLKQYI